MSDSSPFPAEPRLFFIRGQRVILDSDLARLYGVSTKRFNEAFKRNEERFPEDFAFRLTSAEDGILRSQFATSKTPNVPDDSGRRGGRRSLPWVFTEHGAVMACNLLKSGQAVRMSVFVVRAFVKMREQIAANADVLRRLAEIDKSLLQHDSMLLEIYDKILPLLTPEEPEPPPDRRMGFHRGS